MYPFCISPDATVCDPLSNDNRCARRICAICLASTFFNCLRSWSLLNIKTFSYPMLTISLNDKNNGTKNRCLQFGEKSLRTSEAAGGGPVDPSRRANPMRIQARVSTIRAFVIVAAVWLASSGSAWAGGGGGEDLGGVQEFLNNACASVGLDPCPQLPTISGAVLEIAGLINARPEAIRYAQNVPGASVYAGNTLAESPVKLSSVTPIAFIAARTGQGQAAATQLYDTAANSFFYAVTTLGEGTGTKQPETINLFYDYHLRNIPIFVKGQTVAKISLPLVVRKNDGTEQMVCGAKGCPASVATLNIIATCTGGPACLKGEVEGVFPGTTTTKFNAQDLGIAFTVSFGGSPTSALPHAIFAVQVPLVVNMNDDASYFALSPITGLATFSADQIGHPVAALGGSVGIPPYAAPKCLGKECPASNPPPSTFGFCASFANNFTGLLGKPAPAVAAFVQLGTDGETLVSAPLPPLETNPPLCPF
jgi:hypothetical protein